MSLQAYCDLHHTVACEQCFPLPTFGLPTCNRIHKQYAGVCMGCALEELAAWKAVAERMATILKQIEDVDEDGGTATTSYYYSWRKCQRLASTAMVIFDQTLKEKK